MCKKKDEEVSKLKKVIVLLFLSVFISSCGGDKQAKQNMNQPAPEKPTDVAVYKIVPSFIEDKYIVPGVAEAWDDITVPAETSGPVTWIGVEEGSFVKKGEPLLRVNTDNLMANLNTAKVQLENDKKEYIRQKNLYAQKSVSQKQYDTAKKTYDLSIVTYKLALDEYNKATIKSPVQGIVDEIIPDVGEYLSPGNDVARMIDMSKLKIYVNIPEKSVKYLKAGQEVDVYVAETGGENSKSKGIINYISVVSDPDTLTHKVRIDVPLDKNIRPGRIVRANIIRQSYNDVIVIDLYSLIDKDNKKYVFVNNNGRAEERLVEAGEMIGDKVIIKSGLKEGEELIVKGQQFLKDGSLIRVAE